MKIFFSLLAFALFVVRVQGQMAEEQTIIALENQRIQAIDAHDNSFLVNLYDDKFHGITPNGHELDKAQLLELTKSNNPFVVFSIDALKAQIYGATAVVTGTLVSKSKSGNVLGHSRFIHIYLKTGDQWKIIEAQNTLVLK